VNERLTTSYIGVNINTKSSTLSAAGLYIYFLLEEEEWQDLDVEKAISYTRVDKKESEPFVVLMSILKKVGH